MREQELREDSYFREGRDFSSEIFLYFFTRWESSLVLTKEIWALMPLHIFIFYFLFFIFSLGGCVGEDHNHWCSYEERRGQWLINAVFVNLVSNWQTTFLSIVK